MPPVGALCAGICDAEIRCLPRVLLVFADAQTPVTLLGCPSTLFNVFSEWCRVHERPVPLSLSEYSSAVFNDHVREACMVRAHSLDPFGVLDYLVLRFSIAVHQPWLLTLVTVEFRLCVQRWYIPSTALGALLEEFVDFWEVFKLFFKESGTTPTPRGRTPVDLGQMVISDTYVLPRLNLLHVLVSCFQSIFEKQADESVTDYSCRNYAEFCFLY